MNFTALVQDAAVARKELQGRGLPCQPPPLARAARRSRGSTTRRWAARPAFHGAAPANLRALLRASTRCVSAPRGMLQGAGGGWRISSPVAPTPQVYGSPSSGMRQLHVTREHSSGTSRQV
jgi:hypothetical protein